MEAKVEPPVIDEHVCELCKCHVNESDWQVGTYFYFWLAVIKQISKCRVFIEHIYICLSYSRSLIYLFTVKLLI